MAQFHRYITGMPRFLSVRNALSLAEKISLNILVDVRSK